MGRQSVELRGVKGDGVWIGSGEVWIEICGGRGGGYIGIGRHGIVEARGGTSEEGVQE
jgi:hypothetical protein